MTYAAMNRSPITLDRSMVRSSASLLSMVAACRARRTGLDFLLLTEVLANSTELVRDAPARSSAARGTAGRDEEASQDGRQEESGGDQ